MDRYNGHTGQVEAARVALGLGEGKERLGHHRPDGKQIGEGEKTESIVGTK